MTRRINLIFVAPFVALLFPPLYAREEPALFGLPFFYWYQLAWILLGSAITAVAYARNR